MELFAEPFRRTVRKLVRQPGFTLVTVLTLAVGIGANSVIFSVVDAVLFKPLPYPEPERLVGVWHTAPGVGMDQFEQSDATYLLYREESRTLAELGLYADLAVNLTGGEEPERLPAARVTASLFPTLETAPALGRGFREEEERPGAEPVVILSHGLWSRRFGADPGRVGETVLINGVARRVVGVMPAGFAFPSPETELWLPVEIDPLHVQEGNFSYGAVGRLAPGATAAEAEGEISRLAKRLPEVFPEVNAAMIEKARFAARVIPLKEDVVGDVSQVLWILLGTVGIILLVACANVANLFLVRAEGRGKEVAVRTALGASRAAVIRSFLGESTVLAVAGGVVGLALAVAGLEMLVTLGPENLPRLHEVGIDARVLAFTAALTLLAGFLFGFFPALRATGGALTPALKEGGRSATSGRERHRARSLLVVAQVALALVLVTASGLLVRSFWRLRAVDPGFAPENVLTLRLSLPASDYPDGPSVAAFYDQALERIRALPGVDAAGAASRIPLTHEGQSSSSLVIEDFPLAPDELPHIVRIQRASPGYFETLGTPLVSGRLLQPADHQQRTGALLVNEAFARRFWPGQSALGKRLRLWLDEEESPAAKWYTIAGVVGSVRDDALHREPEPAVFYPLLGYLREAGEEDLWLPRTLSLAVRASVPPESLAGPVRAEIWSLDADLPIAQVRTLERIVAASTARTSFTMLLLLLAAAVALLLGSVGLYGVISYVVAQRTREIGVRMALGARRVDVSRMVVGQGLAMAGLGIALGLAGALAVTRLLAALLFQVGPRDLGTFLAAALLLLAVGLVASVLPAHRATRVDPNEALRYE